MSLLFSYKPSYLVIALITLVLSACGGGGDSQEGPQRSEVRVTPLTGLNLEFDENTPIQLSLNVENPDNIPLSFDWNVESTILGATNIAFTGQNTDTIRFTAPEVNSLSTITVSVRISTSDNSILLGSSNSSTRIRINNTTPITPEAPRSMLSLVTNDSIIQGLPEVDNIDVNGFSEQGTWSVRRFDSDGDAIFLGSSFILFSQRESDGSQTINNCTLSEPSDFEEFILDNARPLANGGIELQACENSSLTTHVFQDGNTITTESRCDGELVSATTYIQLSDQIVRNYGQIEVTFDSSEPLNTSEDVCFFQIKGIERVGSQNIELSTVAITANYQDTPIAFLMLVDDISGSGLNFLSDFLSGNNIFRLLSPLLPNISNINADGGSISFRSIEVDHIEGSFRADIPGDDGINENVDGSFFFRID